VNWIKNSLICAAGMVCVSAHAQSLGKERFNIIAPFPPGGPVDVLARVLADGLGKKFNTTAIVENIPGGAGNIGMEKVKRAKADGHTLLVIPAGNITINPTLMAKFPFEIEKDFVPITMLAKAPNVLVAGSGAGIKNVRDLIAQAKAKPGALNFASPGVGSGLHLAGELLKAQAGIEMTHVPYKGSPPALNDVLGGQVPLMFSNLPTAQPHIKSGKLIALGITDSVRTPSAPDIPTLAEQGVADVVVISWYGLFAPAGTPAALVDQLYIAAKEIVSAPQVREQLSSLAITEVLSPPAQFATAIRAETQTWAKIIRSKNITAE
jgi:tripartite-type tricarboxylate transporter receptor subunit TctC